MKKWCPRIQMFLDCICWGPRQRACLTVGTLPPIIMEVENGVLEVCFVSKWAIFHFHDYLGGGFRSFLFSSQTLGK